MKTLWSLNLGFRFFAANRFVRSSYGVAFWCGYVIRNALSKKKREKEKKKEKKRALSMNEARYKISWIIQEIWIKNLVNPSIPKMEVLDACF